MFASWHSLGFTMHVSWVILENIFRSPLDDFDEGAVTVQSIIEG